MGLCITAQQDDYEDIKRYDGGTLLCFRHGEGTYLYENGDVYKGEWKWDKKHGHGVYTHANGEIKQGYFYQNEYIGQDPGNLFAVTSCFAGCFGSRSAEPLANDEEIRNQLERVDALRERVACLAQQPPSQPGEMAEQNAKRREERKKRREEMRQKYNI